MKAAVAILGGLLAGVVAAVVFVGWETGRAVQRAWGTA